MYTGKCATSDIYHVCFRYIACATSAHGKHV